MANAIKNFHIFFTLPLLENDSYLYIIQVCIPKFDDVDENPFALEVQTTLYS